MKVLRIVRFFLIQLTILGMTGCLSISNNKCSDPSRGSSCSLEEKLMLPVAEKRLLEKIHAQGIGMLSAIDYTAEDPSYLIVDGQFDFDFGSVIAVYVLRLEKATDSWETAEVYLYKSSCDYVDKNGERVQRDLLYPSELISLPEDVRTNFLATVETAPWYKK